MFEQTKLRKECLKKQLTREIYYERVDDKFFSFKNADMHILSDEWLNNSSTNAQIDHIYKKFREIPVPAAFVFQQDRKFYGFKLNGKTLDERKTIFYRLIIYNNQQRRAKENLTFKKCTRSTNSVEAPTERNLSCR